MLFYTHIDDVINGMVNQHTISKIGSGTLKLLVLQVPNPSHVADRFVLFQPAPPRREQINGDDEVSLNGLSLIKDLSIFVYLPQFGTIKQ